MSSPGLGPEGLLNYEGTPLSAEEQRRIHPIQRLMRSPIGAVVFALVGLVLCIPALMYIGPPLLVVLWVGLVSAKSLQTLADIVLGRWYFVMVVSFYLQYHSLAQPDSHGVSLAGHT